MKIFYKDSTKSNEYNSDSNEYGSRGFNRSSNMLKPNKMFNQIARRDILAKPIDSHSNIISQNLGGRSNSVTKVNNSFDGYYDRMRSAQKSDSQHNLSFDGPMQLVNEFKPTGKGEIVGKFKSVRDLAKQRDKTNPTFMSFDSSNNKFNPYLSYEKVDDDSKFGRSLTKSDIVGASPKKWKHKPKKIFVDRQEIKSIFGEKPGMYHGFVVDKTVGGTYETSNGGIHKEPYFVNFSGKQTNPIQSPLKYSEDISRRSQMNSSFNGSPAKLSSKLSTLNNNSYSDVAMLNNQYASYNPGRNN